ncbi:NAD(P)/FAD-dependent oxidoreductase, partial [Rhodococcus erythropolis]|uniref:flavin-containing monooxygenase n=1 Tax=Rhodococcus erythropolis TaxID=1833 RepID=UPI001BA6F9B7
MEPDTSLYAIVIGAGFAGIYALHKLRNELGLAVRCFDKADGVGGTWHWNRYPGAKSDSEGFVYRYSFDKEMLQQWSWTNRYLEQAEVLEYLNAVVDRHDLRRDIQLETAVTSARWDDSLARWEVRTDSSKVYRSKYLITALGVLSEPNTPEIPGIEQFSGQVVHTSRWPEGLDVAGRKVGVIGTGSTGTQFICTAAETAQQLTVFQRTAQYSIPSGNGPIDQEYLDRCRSNYDAIWDQVRNSIVGCGFEESTVSATSVS